MQDNPEECFLCGKPATETHHVLGGTANRKLSEKYGLTVRLCHNCHTGPAGVQYDNAKNMNLKARAQIAFEDKYGHDKWMEIFKKCYY